MALPRCRHDSEEPPRSPTWAPPGRDGKSDGGGGRAAAGGDDDSTNKAPSKPKSQAVLEVKREVVPERAGRPRRSAFAAAAAKTFNETAISSSALEAAKEEQERLEEEKEKREAAEAARLQALSGSERCNPPSPPPTPREMACA